MSSSSMKMKLKAGMFGRDVAVPFVRSLKWTDLVLVLALAALTSNGEFPTSNASMEFNSTSSTCLDSIDDI